MQPEASERLPGKPLGLRDFVLMVREDEIHRAGVDVQRLDPNPADFLKRHGGTLQMPARPAPAKGRVPGRAYLLVHVHRELPEGEVAGILLRVFVARHPGPGLELAPLHLRQAPVGGEPADGEVDAVLAPICQPLFQ